MSHKVLVSLIATTRDYFQGSVLGARSDFVLPSLRSDPITRGQPEVHYVHWLSWWSYSVVDTLAYRMLKESGNMWPGPSQNFTKDSVQGSN